MTSESSTSMQMVVDDLELSASQTEALVRLIEAAPRVARRNQFYTWSQSWVGALLPHQLILCGAYDRRRREVTFDVFNNVVLERPLLAMLHRADSPLLALLLQSWIDSEGQPLVLDVQRLVGGPAEDCVPRLIEGGIATLAAHGVARPQRPNEIESFFLFGCSMPASSCPYSDHLELLLPNLHWVWQRVAARERSDLEPRLLPGSMAPRSTGADAAGSSTALLTARELEILHSVRLGYRNHEIGTRLNISPLTVKNHLQKILKKLGAANRAQAVAEAIDLGMLDRTEPRANRDAA